MKKNKNLIILLLVAVIGVVGVTIAYFSSTTTFENVFETPEYGTTYIEKFVSPDNWLPGDETEKTLEVRNSGSVDEAVRVKVEESWVSKNGTTLPLKQGDNVAADIHWINDDDWTKVTVDGENYYYYYYNYKLSPEEITSKLLDKVTFNPLINASTTCTDSIGINEETIRSCKSNGNGYDGATYTLKFTIETVQYNKYKEAWNTSISIATTKEIVVFGLHVNPKSETYETGDKHQMFAFKHAATAQTPAQTDYRYIGNDPYNYVYFNCDDLNNQNEETCEVWRILGVFDVERPDLKHDGQTIREQRIKLVKGYLLSKMDYDINNRNDWTVAPINTYLNIDYYNAIGEAESNGLKVSAQDMIGDATFYLGAVSGTKLESSTYFYFDSTEKIYGEERGTTLCGACNNDITKLTWTGKIGLMYPSDVYMTYANGVNDICYNDPSMCGMNNNNQRSSWLHYTCRFPNDGSESTIYLMSPYAGRSDWVTARLDWGFLYVSSLKGHYLSSTYYTTNGVRPVVYLSADVQIFDGDGSRGNPYKLKK